MVAGHLQEKNGYFYAVLSYKDGNGKRKSKWIPTGLPVRGNKKEGRGSPDGAAQSLLIIHTIPGIVRKEKHYFLFRVKSC